MQSNYRVSLVLLMIGFLGLPTNCLADEQKLSALIPTKPNSIKHGSVVHNADMLQPSTVGTIDLTSLHLTDVQKEKIKAMRQQTAGQIKELHQAAGVQRLALKEIMFDPKASDARIKKEYDQLAQLKNQINELMLEDFLGIKELLTPEQKKLLPQLKPKNILGRKRKRVISSDSSEYSYFRYSEDT